MPIQRSTSSRPRHGRLAAILLAGFFLAYLALCLPGMHSHSHGSSPDSPAPGIGVAAHEHGPVPPTVRVQALEAGSSEHGGQHADGCEGSLWSRWSDSSMFLLASLALAAAGVFFLRIPRLHWLRRSMSPAATRSRPSPGGIILLTQLCVARL